MKSISSFDLLCARVLDLKVLQVGGAPGGDIHYLAQLLGPAHHEPRLPLYHRVVL